MEILFSHSSPCCHVVNLRSKFIKKTSSSCQLKLSAARKYRVLCVTIDSRLDPLSYQKAANFCVKLTNKNQKNGSFNSLNVFQNDDSIVMSESYESYVVDGKECAGDVNKREDSIAKVLIPGLPDDSDGGSSSNISSCFWEWKNKLNVHYEKSGSENVNSPALLFLPGFGVGSFHYEKQLKDLGRDFRVWAVDFLGQGMSLPVEDPAPHSKDRVVSEGDYSGWGLGDKTEPWANELVYSIDLWRDQVRYFIEEVIGEPVYIVGNSLGGYVALYFAATNPQLVKGVTLLNATPFWGFLPNPIRSPRLSKVFPWAGTFPLPANVRKLIEIIWQKISDPRSIREVLKQVYADHTTKVDKVFSQILETTQHPAAAASLASILFAPRGQLSFKEALLRCKENSVPICLMYGKEDPWVKPVWGFQVKREIPEAPYYEISPAGHCPHDEVPEVVNFLLRGWIKNLESHGSVALPLLENSEVTQDDIARDLEFVREGSRKSVRVSSFGSKFSLWNWISSLIKIPVQDLRINAQ